jgi:hypothetical protein
MKGQSFIDLTALSRRLEFCALTGNESLGLGLLAQRATWVSNTSLDADRRLFLITGITVLLRRLAALGHSTRSAGVAGTVGSILPAMEGEISELCSRYDARNGNTAVSEAVRARLEQAPLPDSLDLIPPAVDGVVADHMVAAAWLLEGWALVSADPAAGRSMLLDSAASYAALDALDGELEARLFAARALEDAGNKAPGLDEIAVVAARAEEGFAVGKLRPARYVECLVSAQQMKVRCFDKAEDPDGGEVSALVSGVETALAVAERLSQHFYVGECHSALSSIAGYLLDDQDESVRHAGAARDAYLMSQKPWYAARHELVLAQDALNRGDFQDAERLAGSGIEHGAGTLEPRPMAQLSSRLARAINGQPGRTAAFADASLTAATRWEESRRRLRLTISLMRLARIRT